MCFCFCVVFLCFYLNVFKFILIFSSPPFFLIHIQQQQQQHTYIYIYIRIIIRSIRNTIPLETSYTLRNTITLIIIIIVNKLDT